jgi:hypothetical protein
MSIGRQNYSADHFPIVGGRIYVFDYDGVVIGPEENDVFDLSEDDSEKEFLRDARKHFDIACAGMNLKYQRHLVYQAALLKNRRASEPGPAWNAFQQACATAQVFILTARSGWHATGQVRQFLDQHKTYAVEIFQLGRVPKYLQIKHLLEEFPTHEVAYLDDSPENIEEVVDYFSKKGKVFEDRLKIFRVKRVEPKKETAALRRMYIQEVEAAVADASSATEMKSTETSELLERWKRAADASGEEKEWMHERLNWLLVTQPVLFGAVALSVQYQNACGREPGAALDLCNERNDILSYIRFIATPLGLLISTLVFIGLFAAGRMHWEWTNRLNKLASRLNVVGRGAGHPEAVVTFGTKPYWPARTSSFIAPILAVVFMAIWAILLFKLSAGIVQSLHLVGGVAAIVLLIFGLIWWFHRPPEVGT